MIEDLYKKVGGPRPEALDRLIYVVGSARGGTSITQSILSIHENVIAMRGPSSFLSHVWRYRNKVHERLWRQLLWTPRYLRRKSVRDSLPQDRQRAFNKLINVAVANKNLHDLYRLYPLVKALDPEERRNLDTIHAWLDKGNDFWGVDQLPIAFPLGRFIFVVRDPRGAVASLAKRTADLRPDTDFKVSPADIIAGTIYWRNLVQQQLRFAQRYPDRTIFFRYEDMITHPMEIIPRLYDYLGLEEVSQPVLEKKLSNLNYGASLDSTDSGKGLSTKPLERWRKVFGDDTADLIDSICGPTARRLGYDLGSGQPRHATWAIAGRAGDGQAKFVAFAKLVYMAVRELQIGQLPANFQPFQLLQTK